jgi:hypothetical protein
MERVQKAEEKVKAFVRFTSCGFLSMLLPLAMCSECFGDSAEVLPKGRSAVFIEGKFYPTIDERYGPNGDEEKVAADFNTNLNSTVFPALLALGPTANIGRSVVSFEYDFTIIEFNYAYGITDKLSFGIKIPFWDAKNNVYAQLDTTNANVGKNPLYSNPLAPPQLRAAPLVPLSTPLPPPLTVTKLTTQDAQNLIGKGLDVNGDGRIDIQGYGFNPIESWSRTGVSDIEAYLRYQYYKSENWRLALTPGVRFPTGREDDPDSLVDYPFGAGAWAGLIRFNQDYVGTKNLLLSSTLKFDYYFPDHKVMRIPDNVDQPLTPNKEEVDRQIGSIFEIELSGAYEFYEGLSFSLLYRYSYKWKNDISGNMGFTYSAAEAETNLMEQVYIVGFQYTTVPLYLAKKFPVPLTAFVGYRNRFAGENVLKSEYWDIGLTVYF